MEAALSLEIVVNDAEVALKQLSYLFSQCRCVGHCQKQAHRYFDKNNREISELLQKMQSAHKIYIDEKRPPGRKSS